MNINQKGTANIVLIVVIVAIVAVGGYFVLVKKPILTNQQTPTSTQTLKSTTSTPTTDQSLVKTPTSPPPTSKNEFTIVTINNLVSSPNNFVNKKVQVTGKLIFTGKNYFLDPNFAITDGTNNFSVSAWSPLEIPPPPPGSSGGQHPLTMQSYLDKTLTLQGIVEKDARTQSFFLNVSNAR